MKMQMMFTGHKLTPSSEGSEENYNRLREGHEYSVVVKKARNPKFHRKAFKLIGIMFENQDEYDDIRSFRRALKVKTESVETYFVDNKMVMELNSWDFASMDDLEFQRLYQRILNLAGQQLGEQAIVGFA